MRDYREHLISKDEIIGTALNKLNNIAPDGVLFVVDEDNCLIGSLTDGDIRRGLIKGKTTATPLIEFVELNPKSINKFAFSLTDIIELRNQDFKLVPILNDQAQVVNVLNYRCQKSYLPLDAIIMAGGLGSRLKPMTDNTPKPLLHVGSKPIIDHNIDRLISFGIDDFHISVRYLGEQIESHITERDFHGVHFNFVWEEDALGTLGGATLIEEFKHDYILITNSDILTTLNYEEFFLDFIQNDADMSVVTIPYKVNVPYAVVDTKESVVTGFKEKPNYEFYCNGGIYLVKKHLLNSIPKGQFYNATDLMQDVIAKKMKLVSFPIREYWLDIGKPEDFSKANEDIKFLKL